MAVAIHQAQGQAIEALIPLLMLAEPSEMALRWGLNHLSDAVYQMQDAGVTIGAVSVQWHNDPCEIEELAIVPERQGQGFGRQLVNWVCDEARQRKKQAIIVGTPNASIGNIAFYQKIGFRMDSVRKNYFRYYQTARFEHGIQVQDLLMFRRELR